MSRRYAIRRTVTLLTAPLLLATLVAGAPAAAADEEGAVDWQKIFGKQLKMKGDPAVYTDATGDGVDGATGQPIDTPGYADGTSFAIFETTLKKPGINALSKRQRAKATQQILGNQANPKPGQEWVFVGVQTPQALPAGVPGGVQLNMAFGGSNGPPFYPGGSLDPLAGNETLVIFGQYDGYAPLLTGTTVLRGLESGQRPDYNNAPARGSGYNQGSMWLFGHPKPKNADSVELTIQTIHDGAQVLDQLTTPGGVHRIQLGGPPIPDDFCFSSYTFAILDASDEPVGYQVEFALGTSIPLEATDLDGFVVSTMQDGTQQPAPGGWQVFPETNSAFGNWFVTQGPAMIQVGDLPVDVSSAFGPGALGDGVTIDLQGTMSGRAIGGPCGLIPPIDGGLPVDGALAFLDTFGAPAGGLDYFEFDTPDDSSAMVFIDTAAEMPVMVLAVDNRPSSLVDLDRRTSTSYCNVTSVELGARGVFESCPDQTERFFWLEPFEGPEGPPDFGRIFTVQIMPETFIDLRDEDGYLFPFDDPLTEEMLLFSDGFESGDTLDWTGAE